MPAILDALFAPIPDPERVGWLREWDYAHRGMHGDGAIENSPAAFAAAVARGLGIECDVQRSRDGRAMVFHDWELDRLTGERGAVADRDAAALSAIELAGSGEKIPTLAHLLELVAGKVPLLVEVKSRRERSPVPLCLAIHRALEGYGGRVAVMSFDPRVPSWFAARSPATVRGLVMTESGGREALGPVRRRLALWHARPDFIAYNVLDLPSRFAAAQRRRGLPLLTWTVRSHGLRTRAADHADAPIAEGAGLG